MTKTQERRRAVRMGHLKRATANGFRPNLGRNLGRTLLAAGLTIGATTTALARAVSPVAAASVPDVTCQGDADLVMTAGRLVQRINRVTKSAETILSASGEDPDAPIDVPNLRRLNQVGVSEGGTNVYFTGELTQPETAYWIFDEPLSNLTTEPVVKAGGGVAAAIDPISKLFYYGDYSQTEDTFTLNSYNTATKELTLDLLTVNVPNKPGPNGDLAFDDDGTLYLVSSSEEVYAGFSVEGPLSIYAKGATVTASEFARGKTADAGGEGGVINGIAFGSDNHVWTSGNVIREFSLETNFIGKIDLKGTDIASCVNPTRVRVFKNLPNGRNADTDQFGLEIQNSSNPLDPLPDSYSAETTGTDDGLQDEADPVAGTKEYIGPLIPELGDNYTIKETALGTTNLDNYLSTWECKDNKSDANGGVIASGTGTEGTFKMPDSVAADVECIFTNVPVSATVSVQKDLPAGRVAETDQFTLSLTPGDAASATTTGTATGIQAEKVMLDPALPGTEYTFSEAAAGTTNLEYYDTTWECIDPAAGDGQVITKIGSGAGTTGKVTIPTDGTIDEVVCTFTNTPLKPDLVIAKDSDPVSGTELVAAEEVLYTLTFDNTNGKIPTDIDFVDNLSDVLDDATVTVDPALASGSGLAVSAIADGEFTIKGQLDAGAKATVTYTAKVKADGSRGNNLLVNFLLRPDEEKTVCEDGDRLCTKHPVVEPNLVIGKSSVPVPGTKLLAGEEVLYTLKFDNSNGKAPSPVDFVDNLVDVLDDATVTVAPALATGAGLTVSPVSDGKFTITGQLAKGTIATVTYTAKVKPDGQRGNDLLVNFLLEPNEKKTVCEDNDTRCTKHPVVQPDLVVTKSANPAKGTELKPDQLVTYTLSFDNSKGTAPSPVDFVDNLADVLDDATVTVPPALTSGTGLTVSAIADGKFTVKGQLAAKASATVTYTAKVKPNGDRGNNLLVNYLLKPDEKKTVCEDTDTRCTKHPVPETPAISLIKSVASVDDVDQSGNNTVGDIITYKFTVTNTGMNVLNNIELLDPKLSTLPLTCPKDTLKVGEKMECIGATYLITTADLDKGSVDNTATVSGVDPTGKKVTATDTATEPVVPIINPPTTTTTTLARHLPPTGSSSARPLSIMATFVLAAGSGLLLLSRVRRRRIA